MSSLFRSKTPRSAPSLLPPPSMTPSATSLPLFVHHRCRRPPPLRSLSSSTTVADVLATIKSSSKDALPKVPTPISSSIIAGPAPPMFFSRVIYLTLNPHFYFLLYGMFSLNFQFHFF
ncbi:hypothetical protein ACP275_14G243200 [Erythranthe tilingii]